MLARSRSSPSYQVGKLYTQLDKTSQKPPPRLQRKGKVMRMKREIDASVDAAMVEMEAEIRQRDDEIKRREEAVQAAQQAAEKSKEMDAAAMAEQKRKDEVAAAKRKRDSEKAEAAIRRREEEIKEALKSAKVKEDEARNLEKQLQANATTSPSPALSQLVSSPKRKFIGFESFGVRFKSCTRPAF